MKSKKIRKLYSEAIEEIKSEPGAIFLLGLVAGGFFNGYCFFDRITKGDINGL